MANVVTTTEGLQNILEDLKNKKVNNFSLVGALFHAAWHEPSIQMHNLVQQLQKDFKTVFFLFCDADQSKELLENLKIDCLPTIVFFNGGLEVSRHVGANPSAIVKKLTEYTENLPTGKMQHHESRPSGGNGDNSLESKLKKLINFAPIMMFIKGSRQHPFCKFTKALLGLMNESYSDVEFGTFNILDDQEVREGLKKYSNWPTYPQVYIKGELIGGIDIIEEMHKEGSLRAVFNQTT